MNTFLSMALLPRRVELPLEAGVNVQVRPAAIAYTDAFAKSRMNAQVVEQLVFEANVGRQPIGPARFFAADEIKLGQQLRPPGHLPFLAKRHKPYILRALPNAAEFRVSDNRVAHV